MPVIVNPAPSLCLCLAPELGPGTKHQAGNKILASFHPDSPLLEKCCTQAPKVSIHRLFNSILDSIYLDWLAAGGKAILFGVRGPSLSDCSLLELPQHRRRRRRSRPACWSKRGIKRLLTSLRCIDSAVTCLNRQMVYFLLPPPLSASPCKLQGSSIFLFNRLSRKTLRSADCLDYNLTYRRFKRHYSRPVHNRVVHTARASNLLSCRGFPHSRAAEKSYR